MEEFIIEYTELTKNIIEPSDKLAEILNFHIERFGYSMLDLVMGDPLTVEALTALLTEAVNIAEAMGIVKVDKDSLSFNAHEVCGL